jgi:hypothetical protein
VKSAPFRVISQIQADRFESAGHALTLTAVRVTIP